MDYLQYRAWSDEGELGYISFKPYYKWITFNTTIYKVSNSSFLFFRFKPYYKWITFNTLLLQLVMKDIIMRFKPYYKWITFNT